MYSNHQPFSFVDKNHKKTTSNKVNHTPGHQVSFHTHNDSENTCVTFFTFLTDSIKNMELPGRRRQTKRR